jgi:hypothetical protein
MTMDEVQPPRQPDQDPRSTIERGKEHVEEAEDRAKRDPSPAREAGDGPASPGHRETRRDDERTQIHDVLTPDDAPSGRN